jgi:glycosyltransferase involved in cell wall biosynthesis
VCAEDPVAIADAIEALEQSSRQERESMGMLGKQYAISHYNYEVIAERLAKEVMA